MRLIVTLCATAGLVTAVLLGAVSSAQADTCPAEEYLFSSSKSDPPYQCGVHHWSSKKSIGAFDTKSWSSDTALGYSFKSKCIYRSDNDTTYVWDYDGPSYWISFTNWDDGTRHFGTGVIFATGSVDSDQYSGSNSCANGDGKIKNSLKKVTTAKITGIGGNLSYEQPITINGTISPSDTPGNVGLMVDGEQAMYNDKPVGAEIKSGKFAITWLTPFSTDTKTYELSVAYGGNTKDCPKAASWCGWAPALSKSFDVTIKGSDPIPDPASVSDAGTDPLLENEAVPADVSAKAGQSDPGVRVINVSTRMPKRLGAKCPTGHRPLNAELWGGSSHHLLRYGKFGVRLKAGAIRKGRRAGIQLTCRKGGKNLSNRGRLGLGTPKNDYMRTKARGATLFGGVSDDALVVRHRNGVANGGYHDDLITLRNAGVAIGGPGDDMLRSLSRKRTLLIGGRGEDLIAASGRAWIDVRDGQADRVVCRGKKVRVKADRRDRLRGACIRI